MIVVSNPEKYEKQTANMQSWIHTMKMNKLDPQPWSNWDRTKTTIKT